MTVTLTNKVQRLSYTRRDIDLIDEEVDKFLTHFIPVIKNTGTANIGRLFLRIMEGLVDKLNYSLDMKFRQSVLKTIKELQAAMDITELVRYRPSKTSVSSVDLTATTIGGAGASVGGIPIAQYSQFLSDTTPVKNFLSITTINIPEGGTTATIPCVQGIRVIGATLLASAVGEPNEEVTLPVTHTPDDYLEILVNGNTYSRQPDLKDSEPEDLHYYTKLDEDKYTTVVFGDGTYGIQLTIGDVVTTNYIQCLGEDGNTPRGKITKVVGVLATQVYVTNVEVATGGSNGDTVEDIKRKAPLQVSTFWMASNDRTYAALAQDVPGVFKALAKESEGPYMILYIMPVGGGVASGTLLTLVETTLASKEIAGMTLSVNALKSAHIWIQMRVILKSSNVDKAVARKRIYEAISSFKLDGSINLDGALYFRNLTIARGFALSDVSGILENLDNGELVDYVDFLVLTRYPTVTASNPAAPEFVGEITPSSTADYDDWSIQAVTTTTYYVFKNTVLNGTGTRGEAYTSALSEITFTLGTTTDTFTVGDNWTFKTSAYRNNMRLDTYEFMELVRDSDLEITIYWPHEFVIGE